MRIRFLEITGIELAEAVGYSNYGVPGPGQAFLTEVVKGFDRIGKFPEAWQSGSKRTRR
jgi:hypothetical protein